MRRVHILFAVLVMLATAAIAGRQEIEKTSRFGPAISTSWTSPTIRNAAGAGVRNCLSSADVQSNSFGTFRVLDGGTTIYAIDLSSGSTLIRAWDDAELCGTANTGMTVYTTTSAPAGGGGVLYQNITGYTY